jgi:nucleoside-diphosphate-sugar epimerase
MSALPLGDAGVTATTARAITPFQFAFPTPSSTICVTGASGYIAGFIVAELLAAGHTVHATVRDPAAARCAFLPHVAAGLDAADRLKMFAADLSRPESFEPAIAGCSVVVHAAAVVGLSATGEPFASMIDPSVNGTRAIAEICNRTAGVRRLVITSSVATNTQPEAHRQPKYRGAPYMEEEYRLDLRPSYNPYAAEKTLSELAAIQTFSGEVIALLPCLTLGPLLSRDVRSSMEMMRMILLRERPLLPPLQFSYVDVRDVAAAHHGACFMPMPVPAHPEGATAICPMRYRRYNLCGHDTRPTSMPVAALAERVIQIAPGLRVPTYTAPLYLMRVAARWDARLTEYTLTERMAQKPGYNCRRIEDEMGLVFRYSLNDTVLAAVSSFREFGLLPSLE